MAGSFAKIFNRIWADPDFRSLTRDEQWLFFALISQPELNFAGVVTTTPKRLAGCAEDFTVEDLADDLKRLQERRYVVVDDEHDEILVRSFIRHDGGWRTPNVLLSIVRDAEAVRSPRIRAALLSELARLDVASLAGKKADEMRALLERVAATLRGTLPTPPPEPFGKPFPEPLAEPFGEGSGEPFGQPFPEGVGEPMGEPSVEPIGEPTVVVAVVVEEVEDRTSVEEQKTSSSETASRDGGSSTEDHADADNDAGRQDLSPELVAAIDRLCDHLVQRIVGNGAKAPTVGKKWRDAARLMLTNDRRPEDHIHRAIDWCQNDEFWRANILSMPTLRAKYDQLKLAAARPSRALQRAAAAPTTSPRDRWMERE